MDINNQFTNHKFKDRLFCSIFGREEHKHYLLELYNALNGTKHTNVNDIEFTTIENAIYITMRNDVSFLIGSQLNLYEQQSTFNPNMPLRGLFYFAQLYQIYLAKNNKDFYSTKHIKIPTPKFVVLYNGSKDLPDVSKLKLSDAFEIPTETKDEFEWTATVININKNHNVKLFKACKSLYNYTEFVAMFQDNIKMGQNKNIAINNAVNFAIKNDFLDGFFKLQKSEVFMISLTEFDQEEYDRNRREDARYEKAMETAQIALENNIPLEMIVKLTGLSEDEIKQIEYIPATSTTLQ